MILLILSILMVVAAVTGLSLAYSSARSIRELDGMMNSFAVGIFLMLGLIGMGISLLPEPQTVYIKSGLDFNKNESQSALLQWELRESDDPKEWIKTTIESE